MRRLVSPLTSRACLARRLNGYKRPMLPFSDLSRLAALLARHLFQVAMAGKANPQDIEGKRLIERIHQVARQLEGKLTCVFLPGHDMGSPRASSPAATSGSTRLCLRWEHQGRAR